MNVPKHDTGGSGQLDELPQSGERLRREAVPGLWAAATRDIDEKHSGDRPPRDAERERDADEPELEPGYEEPADKEVDAERGGGGSGVGQVLPLALQEQLQREEEGLGEVQRDEPHGDPPRHRRQLRRLPRQQEQVLGEEVHGRQQQGAHEEDDPRALHVHSHHVVLLGAVRLATQRLQRARHAKLYVHMHVYFKSFFSRPHRCAFFIK